MQKQHYRNLLARIGLLLLLATPAKAAEEIEIPLSDGSDAFVTRYAAEGDTLVVWFPSEFGISPRQGGVAEALAARGIETWLPDLHATWFLPVGRYSLTKTDPAFLKEILQAARIESGRGQEEGQSQFLGQHPCGKWHVADNSHKSAKMGEEQTGH